MSLTFGVELELVFPVEERTTPLRRSRIGYHSGHIQAPGMPDGWCASNDSSIVDFGGGGFTAELISLPLMWPRGIGSVERMLSEARGLGGRTNHTCGLHVHVGCGDWEPGRFDALKALVRRYELALYGTAGAAIVARMAGEHGRRYCKPSTFGISGGDRYQGLNLARSTAPGLRRAERTVEFRMFAASTDDLRVIGCIAAAVVLCARSDFDDTIDPDARIPRPVTAMAELVDVIRDDCPQLGEATTATLMRQARKAERRLGAL